MTNGVFRRRNLRLPAYDYAAVGTYFVTVCVQNRSCVLGRIQEGEVRLSPVGEMVEIHLQLAMDRYAGVDLDMHVLMPNHLHALINIGWTSDRGLAGESGSDGRHRGLQLRCDDVVSKDAAAAARPSLYRVMQWFKSATTNEYIRRVKNDGWPRFPGKLWQPNYYEHVVRDQSDLDRIRTYIVNNPGQWEEDTEYSSVCRGFGS